MTFRSILGAVLILIPVYALMSQDAMTDNTVQEYDLSLSDHAMLNGFTGEISGASIDYHSSSREVHPALLVRAISGKMAIEWETEAFQVKEGKNTVTFTWLSGLGCTAGQKPFDLYIDGMQVLTFQSWNRKSWSVAGEKGAVLSFKSDMRDKHGDRFGLMNLTLPSDAVTSGKKLRLKIVGQNAGSSAWVMVFKEEFREKITISPLQAIMKKGDEKFQPVNMSIVYMGKPVEALVKVEGMPDFIIPLNTMYNRFQVHVPVVDTPRKLRLRVRIEGNDVLNTHVMIHPVRKFTVYMVQHTHTDIGYTRPQTEILPEHLRYIDYALDFCDQTDDYPDDSKFRWTCEASWAVREYLMNRPAEQIDRLKKRVKEGRIEITGMMFNMSDIADENSYVDFVQSIRRFKENDLSVVTAMQNDVNGFAWCLVDYFKDTGVEYLTMGTHGHKALIAFEHPTPFWMESPAGNRLLAFRADHYMTGNNWGIHTDNLENLEKDFLKYLDDLFGKGYPYDKIAVQHSGYFTDNSPPAMASCDLIRRWNEKYEWPKLKTAVAREFMDDIKAGKGAELPVYRAAWPDWWTDGFGSAARETAASRSTHAEMIANLGLLSMAKASGADLPEHIHDRIRVIQDALIFYDEHTFGAAESISDPMSENSQVQWMEKAAYVWDAVKNSRLLTETAMGLIQPYLSQGEKPTITIFNTLNWKRSGWLEVYMDNEILPRDKPFRIADSDGNTLPAQILRSRSEGNYWALWVEDIPALGYKTYEIETREGVRDPSPEWLPVNNVLENDYYRLTLNPARGTVSGLYDKELETHLVDDGCEWELGQFIYETTGYRNQLDRFVLENYERQTLNNVSMEAGIDGPLWKSVVFKGESEGFESDPPIRFEIRLFKQEKRIEFHFNVRKIRISDPEGVYIAFPFELADSKLLYEVQGGLVEPGKDQIPGSASDWNTIQNFATVRNSKSQIIMGSNGMPLVQLGGINLGKFQYIAQIDEPHIFSWPLNNYWVTNFRDSQEGELSWSYYLTSSSDPSTTFATRFGWGSRVPLLARVLSAGKVKTMPAEQSFLKTGQPGILMIAARPSKDHRGVMLHFRELEGKKRTVRVDDLLSNVEITAIKEVNVLEEPMKDIGSEIMFEPYEVKFITFVFDQ